MHCSGLSARQQLGRAPRRRLHLGDPVLGDGRREQRRERRDG